MHRPTVADVSSLGNRVERSRSLGFTVMHGRLPVTVRILGHLDIMIPLCER